MFVTIVHLNPVLVCLMVMALQWEHVFVVHFHRARECLSSATIFLSGLTDIVM